MKWNPPHPNSQMAGLTWVEPEDLAYPRGGFTRRALVRIRANPNQPNKLKDLVGLLRIVHCSIPDTYFSIPARLDHKHKGFICHDAETEEFTFTPENT